MPCGNNGVQQTNNEEFFRVTSFVSLNSAQFHNFRRASLDVWTWFQHLQVLLLGCDTNAQENLFIAHATPRSTMLETKLCLSMLKQNLLCGIAIQAGTANQKETIGWTQNKRAKGNRHAINNKGCKEWCIMPRANFNKLTDTCTCASFQMQTHAASNTNDGFPSNICNISPKERPTVTKSWFGFYESIESILLIFE